MNNNLKTFQSWANRSSNTIPILDYVRIEDGMATIFDLETTVQFMIKAKDGYYSIRMNELFFIRELDDSFPLSPVKVRIIAKAQITASVFLQYNTLTANDALRPVMNGIQISSEGICASDAHVLRFAANFAKSIDDNFDAILPMVAPLLSRCKVDPNELINVELIDTGNYNHIACYFQDCVITTRVVEGKYPNYISVVPTDMSKRKFISIPHTAAQEIEKAAKSFKSPLLKVTDSDMVVENIDFNLRKRWDAPKIVDKPSRKPDGVIMPMLVDEDLVSDAPDSFLFGLKPENLARFITLFKGNIILGFEPDNNARPICVWLESTEATKASPAPKASPKPEPKREPAPAPKALSPAPEPEPIPTPTPEPEQEQEPEQETPAPVPAPIPYTPKPKRRVVDEFRIVEYSDKAVALFGPTKAIKDKLMELHGAYSPYLKLDNEPTPGWIFSKKRESAIRELIAS